MNVITQEELKEYLHYNSDGTFTWKKKTGRKSKIGKEAGSHNDQGYILIGFKGNHIRAHRLTWLYHKGYLPENNLDHINRIRDDNRIENLREVSQSCNMRNSNTNSNNTSGITGVCFYTCSSRWVAEIRVNWKKRHLGSFKSKEEAIFHRLAAEQCLDWSGCNSNSDAFLYCKEILNEDR